MQQRQISVGQRQMPVAWASPEGPGPHPAVLVVHEILGLNDDIRRIAARFVAAGYAVLVPDLFHGQGPAPLCMMRALIDFQRRQGHSFTALDAACDWLAARPEVDATRIGSAGFCMGGGFALLLGARSEIGVAAAFYGHLPQRDELARGCPVVASYGGRDLLFGANAEPLRQQLVALGLPHDVKVYPEAGHSFMSQHSGIVGAVGPYGPLRAAHHPAAAEDAWRRTLAFFAEHLGPSGAGARGHQSGCPAGYK